MEGDFVQEYIQCYMLFAFPSSVKAEKGCSERDIECLVLIFHCLQRWTEYSEEMKVELANNGLISRLVTVLFLLQALPLWDLVGWQL